MSAYYNEIDPFAAQWLRNLIAAGHIAAGDVDERSIVDIVPSELAGYTQCHFFAGVGVWSLALRRAGWSDDRPIWTGSCPCQPFSAAGKGDGFADERHLWPAFHHLIRECRPAVVIGEQVASKAVDPWIDLVQTDLEAMGYRTGAVAFPSAGVGAPHIRDRTYWVADGISQRRQTVFRECGSGLDRGSDDERARVGLRLGGEVDRLAHPDQRAAGARGVGGGVGDTANQSRERITGAIPPTKERLNGSGLSVDGCGLVGLEYAGSGMVTGTSPGPTNGFWANCDWLYCRDGGWRPVEPGTFPLAHGAPGRVGRLRAYGNAINAQAAQAFIEVVMECRPC